MPVVSYAKWENETPSIFMRLEEGENRIRIVSEPHGFKKTFREEDGPKHRYGWVVISRADDTVRLLEVGPQVFGQVVALANDDEFGDPMGYDIKIFREGTKLDTEYKVVPSPEKSKITVEEKKAIEAADLDVTRAFAGEEDVEPNEVEIPAKRKKKK